MRRYTIAIYSLIVAIIFFIPIYFQWGYFSHGHYLEIPIRLFYLPSLIMTLVTGGGHTAAMEPMLIWMWIQNYLICKLVIFIQSKFYKKS